MKEITVQIKTEFEKVNAIRIYLTGKDMDLERELTDYVDALYKKYVPAQVREYIEKSDSLELDADDKSLPRHAARRKAANIEAESGEDKDASKEQ